MAVLVGLELQDWDFYVMLLIIMFLTEVFIFHEDSESQEKQ